MSWQARVKSVVEGQVDDVGGTWDEETGQLGGAGAPRTDYARCSGRAL